MIKKYPKAQKKFDMLSRSARYTIGWQLQTAKKQETQIARMQKIINNLENDQV